MFSLLHWIEKAKHIQNRSIMCVCMCMHAYIYNSLFPTLVVPIVAMMKVILKEMTNLSTISKMRNNTCIQLNFVKIHTSLNVSCLNRRVQPHMHLWCGFLACSQAMHKTYLKVFVLVALCLIP